MSGNFAVPQRGTALVSWLLIFMALAAFAPCVLLPEWRSYQAVQLAEQTEAHRVDAMQQVVDRERRFLDGLQTDPAVVARLAKRGLGFEAIGSQSVRVPVATTGAPQGPPFSPARISLPPVIANAALYLPDFDYDRVFCEEQSRSVIMLMSCALMIVAVCLRKQPSEEADR